MSLATATVQLDDLLRGRGVFATLARFAGQVGWLLGATVVFGLLYGAVMGTFTGIGHGRPLQILYSAVKAPMLLLATFALCLPSFFVIASVAGLREDFAASLKALLTGQACNAILLAALAPVTALFYLTTRHHDEALLFNAAVFAVATLAGQRRVARHYRPLIRRNRRHRPMLYLWYVLYAFVGVQMAWVLRPFIGSPGMETTFFRRQAWGNAYVVLAKLIAGLLG